MDPVSPNVSLALETSFDEEEDGKGCTYVNSHGCVEIVPQAMLDVAR